MISKVGVGFRTWGGEERERGIGGTQKINLPFDMKALRNRR